MESVLGRRSQSSIDKSRILDVKPMRTLVPTFPTPPQAPPFVCSSLFGPFSSGFTPYYPFSMPPGTSYQGANQDGGFGSPVTAVSLRSFGTPEMGDFCYGDTGSKLDGRVGSGRGKKRKSSS